MSLSSRSGSRGGGSNNEVDWRLNRCFLPPWYEWPKCTCRCPCTIDVWEWDDTNQVRSRYFKCADTDQNFMVWWKLLCFIQISYSFIYLLTSTWNSFVSTPHLLWMDWHGEAPAWTGQTLYGLCGLDNPLMLYAVSNFPLYGLCICVWLVVWTISGVVILKTYMFLCFIQCYMVCFILFHLCFQFYM
jgi:hypothetical protein